MLRKNITNMLLAGAILSYLVIIIVVHYLMASYIEQESKQALDIFRQELWEDSPENLKYDTNLFQVLCVELDAQLCATQDYQEEYTQKEDLIVWIRDHTISENKLTKVSILSEQYYCELIPCPSEEEASWMLLFIDVTNVDHFFGMIQKIMYMIMSLSVFLVIYIRWSMNKCLEAEKRDWQNVFENITHELKTPLVSIRGYAEALKEGMVKNPGDALDIIIKESDFLKNQVDELMTMIKLRRGITELNLEKISIEELVGDCIDEMLPLLNQHQLTLAVDISDQFVYMDYPLMRHAFSNLLSNSCKYANKRISVTYSNGMLKIWNDTQKTMVETSHLFERYYIGNNGNMGIGLSLAKEIIEMHGFSIEAVNEQEGICFLILMNEK